MAEKFLVLGFGPVGRACTKALIDSGHSVIVAQRKLPAALPDGAEFRHCDVLDWESLREAIAGVSQLVVAIGLPYKGKLWRCAWPQAMSNLLAVCEMYDTRMLFIDNLYMYGLQTTPLHEGMALTNVGLKPGARSEVTRLWQQASAQGRVRVAALRASDFFGPDTGTSQLGDLVFGALANSKAASMIVPPDLLHDFTYLPDLGRAAVSLIVAPDRDYGQAWHVPNAPVTTPRKLVAMAAEVLGVKARISALPLVLLPVVGLFSPTMRELVEMRFQWRGHYRVDHSKFANRFWGDPTPFKDSIRETAISFRR
jgi:nucleoside-diphosphate-sugar epimerase